MTAYYYQPPEANVAVIVLVWAYVLYSTAKRRASDE